MTASSDEPWAAEHVVDAPLAAALVGAQFPDLAGAPLASLGAGFDNTAWLVGGAWVFRFPRRAVAVGLLEREARFLRAYAGALPLAVPRPERLGAPADGFPWPFVGYRALPGRTACHAALDDDARAAAAEPLAAFLAALHALPAGDAAVALAGDELGRLDVPVRRARAWEVLEKLVASGVLDGGAQAAVARVFAGTPDAVPRPPVVPVHGDLYARHLLVDERGRPTGVIDWGDVHAGDRAVDLALGYAFLPPRARDRFFARYGTVDELTHTLARFRACYHAIAVARYAHAVGDAPLLAEGRGALLRATC